MACCREPDARPGSYALIFQLTHPLTITVGRLGPRHFTPGYYLYCGSALGPGGVAARLHHHQTVASRPHWHLDYLRPHLALLEVWFTYGDKSMEHLWSQQLAVLRGASRPHAGFGSSDCGCLSHLCHLGYLPSFRTFRHRVRAALPDHQPLHRQSLAGGAPGDH